MSNTDLQKDFVNTVQK